MASQVRVRFAPSPTGALHVGGARTALFNWLFARKNQGAFILRIEDTDVRRSTEAALEQILDSLQWLGLEWDEGPFFQSKRKAYYQEAVAQLLRAGKAYKCFCTAERLDELREQAKATSAPFVYDRRCAGLSEAEVRAREDLGERYTVRFKVPQSGNTTFDDAIFGPVRVENELIGDFVIVRSDGLPTYNLCAVVDDQLMEISHVIRGDDHLPNTPKQILLYDALQYPIPRFVHLPLILGPDKTPLSKRHGATDVLQLREEGFLPEAVVNFLALLGWAYNGTRETFSLDELILTFSLEGVSKAAAVFDATKLLWMNGLYMRSLPEELVVDRAKAFLARTGYDVRRYDSKWLGEVIALEIERSKTLKEMAGHLEFFLSDQVRYDDAAVAKFLLAEKSAEILMHVRNQLASLEQFDAKTLEHSLRFLAEQLSVKFAKVVHPMRVALTGRSASPGIFDVITHLGKSRVISRLDSALEMIQQRQV
jgi:glutamyl-tRNA synthetase